MDSSDKAILQEIASVSADIANARSVVSGKLRLRNRLIVQGLKQGMSEAALAKAAGIERSNIYAIRRRYNK